MGEPISFAKPSSWHLPQPWGQPAQAPLAPAPAPAPAPPTGLPGTPGNPIVLPPLPPSAPAAALAPSTPPRYALADMRPAVARALKSSIMVNAFVPPTKDSPHPISGGGATVIEPGLAVISAHVIAGSTAVVYSQTNERGEHVMKTAKVVGVAPEVDIALLQLEDATIPPAERAPADPQDGDQIFVIGDAENHNWSKSFGFVTNTHVNLNAPVCDCTQTDAGINPGDSGGGAFDTQGRMSGMAEALYDDRQSMGFVIPMSQLFEVVEHLKKGDLAPTPFGLKLTTVDTLWAIANHTRDLDGALVKEDRAPLAAGDRIVAINGARIANPAVALTRIALTPAGTKMRFLVDRNGQRITVEAKR